MKMFNQLVNYASFLWCQDHPTLQRSDWTSSSVPLPTERGGHYSCACVTSQPR